MRVHLRRRFQRLTYALCNPPCIEPYLGELFLAAGVRDQAIGHAQAADLICRKLMQHGGRGATLRLGSGKAAMSLRARGKHRFGEGAKLNGSAARPRLPRQPRPQFAVRLVDIQWGEWRKLATPHKRPVREQPDGTLPGTGVCRHDPWGLDSIAIRKSRNTRNTRNTRTTPSRPSARPGCS